jgi:hypothetical protein
MIAADASDTLSHNWKELRNKVRQRWTSLSEADLKTIDGNLDVLVDLLRERYGHTQLIAEEEVDRFLRETVAA